MFGAEKKSGISSATRNDPVCQRDAGVFTVDEIALRTRRRKENGGGERERERG